jgi:uncharacterized protein (DUF952 family)
MRIYKVFRAEEWAEFDARGETRGAPVDVADGYVHFSTAAQLAETLRRHFAAERGLWLLAVDAEAAGEALRWEASRGGALFPHLYRTLVRADLASVCRIEDGPDGPLAPEDLA